MPELLPSDARVIDELTGIVSQAAAAILERRRGTLDARTKADQSPVTAADEAAQAIILEGLARLLPGLSVLSEEAIELTAKPDIGPDFVLVDPLDGTRELIAGRNEFSVNVALVRAHVPVLGIVAAPALGLIWRTAASGGAERFRLAPGAPVAAATNRCAIHTRALPPTGVVAALSRSHLDPDTEAFLARIPGVSRMVAGSAIKLCRVAEGSADIYPRLAPTCQWDIGAGHAVLTAAGGMLTTPQRTPLLYRPQADGLVVPAFIAWGDPQASATAWR